MIAHRLNTLKDCDQIYIMEKGSIIAQGTYKELSNKNKQFREMGKMPENKNIKFHIPV
jgi:ATP-binding cassette, subfamily B, bacterial PglK